MVFWGHLMSPLAMMDYGIYIGSLVDKVSRQAGVRFCLLSLDRARAP